MQLFKSRPAPARPAFGRTKLFISAAALAAALAIVLAPLPGVAQGPKGKAAKAAPKGSAFGDPYGPYYTAPEVESGPFTRTPDGHPDMQGYWTPRFNRTLFDIEGAGGSITDPGDQRIPYRPEARAKARDLVENHIYLEPELHCYQSGVPHAAYQQFGYQIMQSPGFVTLMPEFNHGFRVIPTDARPHIKEDVHLFMGDSVGHWEGDTLVVDTTNQNGLTWFDMEGNFTTTALHVVERFTMIDANTIHYDATMTDPSVYTRPWSIAGTLGRHPDESYELMEAACHEGNRDLAHYPEAAGGTAKEVGPRLP